MKKSKKALLWTIVPVLGVSSGVAGAVAGVTNQKTSVDTNNVATSSSATTMATRSTSNFKVTKQTREVLAYSGLSTTETLFVVVTGAPKYGILNYKWEVNKGSGWETHTSTNRSSISVDISDRFTTMQNWTFRCTISDTKSSAKVVSEDIKFTITPKAGRYIQITQPTETLTVSGGEEVTLKTSAVTLKPYQSKNVGYQWFEYESKNDKFTLIEGADQSEYTFTAPYSKEQQTKKYVCRYYFTDDKTSYISESNQSIVTINKSAKETITVSKPVVSKPSIKVGEETTLSVEAKSNLTSELKYQWHRSDALGKPYELIEGAESPTYTYKATKNDEGKDLFFCVVVTGSMQDGEINHFQSDNAEVKVLSSDGTSGTVANETFASKLSVTSSVTTNQASVKESTFSLVRGVKTPEYTVKVEDASGLTYKWYYVSGNNKQLISGADKNVLTTDRSLYKAVYKANDKHKVGIMCEIYQGDKLVKVVDEKTDSRFYMTVVTRR